MITTHQFITKYPIDPTSKKLILGTIHPHDTSSFQMPFFYGNKNSIWNIINEAYDNVFGKNIDLKNVLIFLKERRISVSDTILRCSRMHPTALDEHLIPEILNMDLITQIKDSEIEEILFTSGFGKNNAFKLFYENILGQKINKEIKVTRTVLLDSSIMGRPIKLTVLLSPSGNANVGVSRSKLYQESKEFYSKYATPVKQFKIDQYKNAFK